MTTKEQIETIHAGIKRYEHLTVTTVTNAMSASDINSPAYAILGTIATVLGTYFMLTPEQQKDFLTPKTADHEAVINLAATEAQAEVALRKQNIQNN